MLDIVSPEIGSLRFWECSQRFPQQFDSMFQVSLPLGPVLGGGRSRSGHSGRGLGEYASRIVESAGLVRTEL
jgi:hypothetical protein